MKNKKKQIIVSVMAVLLLVLLTVGVTYAVFTYTKLGTTENTVTAGTLKFLYTENTGVGAGIALTDALPVSDTVGKSYSTEGKVFDFSIEATNSGTEAIPYEITLRKKENSTLGEEAVKVYLTDMTEDADSEILAPTLYSGLTQTDINVGNEIEKTIYTDSVAGGELTYLKEFRLRMWVAEETDFSGGNYNGKTFIATVNVYSNVPLVSDEDITLRGNAEISKVSVGNSEMEEVTGKDYHYETVLPAGTTEATINVETENPNSTVLIEKIDGLAYNNISNIERMAVAKTITLINGNNWFKVTVISQNKDIEKEYKIKIFVGNIMNASTKLTVGQAVTAIDGSKWHVLEASDAGVETVVLLSDYLLSNDGSYNLANENVIRHFDTSTDAPNVSYNENEQNNIGYFLKNTYEPLVTAALPNTTNITVPTMQQILSADGQTFNQTSTTLQNSWLHNTQPYWTNTKSTTEGRKIWYVKTNGSIDTVYSDWLNAGARPTITTPKTNLLSE